MGLFDLEEVTGTGMYEDEYWLLMDDETKNEGDGCCGCLGCLGCSGALAAIILLPKSVVLIWMYVF